MNDEQATCEVCNGMGIVTADVPVNHPAFGKVFPCPTCGIHHQQVQDMLSKISRLHTQAGKDFDNFVTSFPHYSKKANLSLEIAWRAAMEYAANPEGWLLLHGGTGTGKTHLAAAIGHQAVSTGIHTIFVTVPDLLDHLRNAYAPRAEISYDQRFDQMSQVMLLILDDMGAENQTSWAEEKLYQLINHRHLMRLPTVITTNLSQFDFPDRMRSRMYDVKLSQQYSINAPDFRSNEEKQGVKDLAIAELTDLAGYRNKTFETFNLDHPQTAPLRPIYDKLCAYPTAQAKGWVIISGGMGTGKTHLAAAIANKLGQYAERSEDIVMISLYDLIDFLRAGFNATDGKSTDQRLHSLRAVEYLIIDDFRISERTPDWVQDKLFQLFDYRYTRLLPTVIATADDLHKFLETEHLAPHIFSRLTDRNLCEWYDLGHYDYRKRL
ncbi:MAG: ATP-binding protein [Anaerolineales bacterium]